MSYMLKAKRIGALLVIAALLLGLCCGCQPSEDTSEPEKNITGELAPSLKSTTKKGIAASKYGGGTAQSLEKLEALGASWYYNWGVSGPTTETTLEYVPMVWGPSSATSSNLEKIKKGYENGTYKNLLGFNEPDLAEQSNMTVEQALALWPKLQEIGIRLGSPCPAGTGNYTSGWLKEFMDGCEERGYRVDFIAVHCYQDVTSRTSVNELQRLLTNIYMEYGLPIWLTEFGAIDIATWGGDPNPNYGEEKANEYLTKCTAMLESLGFVERYSFFLDDYGGGSVPTEGRFSRLYTNGKLNSMGNIYTAVESAIPLVIRNKTLPICDNGNPYKAQIVVEGGTGPYTYVATRLPSGVTLDEKTGLLQGTPESGGARVSIQATDSKGQTTYAWYDIKDRDDE